MIKKQILFNNDTHLFDIYDVIYAYCVKKYSMGSFSVKENNLTIKVFGDGLLMFEILKIQTETVDYFHLIFGEERTTQPETLDGIKKLLLN
jgi:hypothetical protein